MSAPDPMKFAEDLTRWAQGLEQKAQRYGELQEQLDRTNVTAESPDGTVRVTVDSTGVPTELTITDRGRSADPRALSAALMATMHSAQAQLRDRVSEMTSATVGDDGPGNDIVAQYQERFPDPVEETAPQPPTMDVGGIDEDTAAPEEPRPPRRRPTRQDDGDDDDFGGPVLR
ncbi:YbaB/EbfC family nucleoid-associated protein [Prauserella cavernicola]|uniref:YbaB/EbfC family nucleoid-associated protein n=1 Tax=Prauserella cavernicola TaxID=2800127 RepID=A0A934V4P3_9PSEU|nr:YbaB/EbfC family nucleoid-associated protein [Prauserella cavernicola]MBK1784315.1 YbaB/EbfC family nucleoid-associated protein [Prauserella cavernicola]